ncbi:MAG: choice-of-anchor B family protein [Gammaproteobacteria bacterium]|nr:choice-of-anchor B family protein [Gammaproteobacteria bacterium]
MLKNILVIFILLIALFSLSNSLAHSGGHPTRFVAPDGVDQGNCAEATEPCKTISYAVSKSSKGDKIRLAAGNYYIQDMDIFYLLNDMVAISGGYSLDDNYKKQSVENNPSTLIGIPDEYHARLKAKGFRILQDSKGNDEFRIKPEYLDLLERYKKITTNVEKKMTCSDGAAGEYDCKDIDLESHLPLSQLSSRPSSANDIWGYRDLNNDREYAVLGLFNGTALIDVTDPTNPVEVGTISGSGSTWRDVKVYQYFDNAENKYKTYAYVTTEAMGGFQVLDLTDAPNSIKLANTINVFRSAHNVYLGNIDYATGLANPGENPYLYIAGSNLGGGSQNGSYRIFDLADPVNPKLVTDPGSAFYMHDATSMTINDSRTDQCVAGHNPCELLIDFTSDRSINRINVDIWDTTDKGNPTLLSSSTYGNASYIHSGWYSKDKNYIFVQDELDERDRGVNTTLYVLDIRNLKSPSMVGSYVGPTKAIDHNGFTHGDKYYMSNYKRGLVVLDVSDPTTPTEVGFFDTYPIPAANDSEFDGAWGAFPYLPSGNILVSDISNGLFVLKDNSKLVSEQVGDIGFVSSTMTLEEANANINISVARAAGSNGQVSIDYATQDGSAVAGEDYTETNGTLTWAAGDMADKTISVAILDDSTQETSESFNVNLSNPQGGAGLNQTQFVVNINASDQPAPVTPPPSNDGGGGGPMAPLTLLALLGLYAYRRR